MGGVAGSAKMAGTYPALPRALSYMTQGQTVPGSGIFLSRAGAGPWCPG